MNLIQQRFNRAAAHYDKMAAVQRDTADTLAALLMPVSQTPGNILDLGSGTGYCTSLLRQKFKDSTLLSLDFASAMNLQAQQNQPQSVQICADFNAIPCKSACFDLIFSSLALQWSADLSITLSEIKRVLKRNGRFIFSTLIENSLRELGSAWLAVDGQMHVNPFPSAAVVKRNLIASGFEISRFKFQSQAYFYPTVLAVLRSLKGVGANTCFKRSISGLGGRKALVTLEKAYHLYCSDNQYPLTYEVLYVAARKIND